jgi:hypothetical protein
MPPRRADHSGGACTDQRQSNDRLTASGVGQDDRPPRPRSSRAASTRTGETETSALFADAGTEAVNSRLVFSAAFLQQPATNIILLRSLASTGTRFALSLRWHGARAKASHAQGEVFLGTAVGIVGAGGVQAADMPVKAQPVQYVKICSLYGDGYYYIPGTDTCLKLGGYVRV